eukprot:1067731-Pyramimonas_sp.AAC.1
MPPLPVEWLSQSNQHMTRVPVVRPHLSIAALSLCSRAALSAQAPLPYSTAQDRTASNTHNI